MDVAKLDRLLAEVGRARLLRHQRRHPRRRPRQHAHPDRGLHDVRGPGGARSRGGGHAVYLDAKRFLPHIPQREYPAQALTCALYLEGGVRAVEIGGLMFGTPDEETGPMRWPELELVRLAVPRRVYTDSHLDYVDEVCAKLLACRESLRGLGVVSRAPVLPHFTARLAPIYG